MNREECQELLKLGEDPLELSVWKWIDIAHYNGDDLMCDNCALCQATEDCDVCIICNDTGETDCINTPYINYGNDPTQETAIAELEYLLKFLDGRETTK